MRSVHLAVEVPGRAPDDVFPLLCDFGRYPELTDDVRSVEVERTGELTTRSTWEVDFRDGVLEWTEDDTVDPERHRLSFTQVDGDFESFEGSWAVEASGTGSVVRFDAEVDVGIASLGALIEPIAERSLRENLTAILRGLFGEDVAVREAAS